MSINNVNAMHAIGAAPIGKEPVQALPQGGGVSFLDILVAASSGNNTPGGYGQKAAAKAELLKLEMMRSALSLDAPPSAPGHEAGKVEAMLALFAENGRKAVSTPLNDGTSGSNGIAGTDAPTGSASHHAAAVNGDRSLDAVIGKASRRHGVEEGLIRAVIRVESNFNPTAVSPAGAQGLMQLMPATASGLGVTNPFNQEQNVMAGTRFLKDMLNRYGGDMDKALAAYNWGPGNLDRGKGRLPQETRDYLVKVKKYYSEYTAA